MPETAPERPRGRPAKEKSGSPGSARLLLGVTAAAVVAVAAFIALGGAKPATAPPTPAAGTGASPRAPTTLPRWQAALASGTARLTVYGDSISEDSPSRAGAWPSLLQKLLGSRIGVATGTGVILLTPNSVSEDRRVTYSGKWSNSPHGIDGAAREAVGPGSDLVFRPATAGDRFIIYYRTGPLWGTFTYQVDGSPPVGVNATVPTNGVASVSIPLTNGAGHTLTIRSPADGLTVDITAVALFNGATGLRLANLSVSDAGTAMFNPPQGIASCFAPVRPDLSVIFLEADDYDRQTPVATYKRNLDAAIGQARLTGDVLLVTSIPELPGSHPTRLSGYTAVLNTLARENHVALLDLSKEWGSFARGVSRGRYQDNMTRPSAKGAAEIARAVYAAIRPTT